MKKTYIIPELQVTMLALQAHLLVNSDPDNPEVDDNGNLNPGGVETKGTSRYNVWDDDWSK